MPSIVDDHLAGPAIDGLHRALEGECAGDAAHGRRGLLGARRQRCEREPRHDYRDHRFEAGWHIDLLAFVDGQPGELQASDRRERVPA
jgi:hypothetical protein